MHSFLKFIIGIELYVFQTGFLSIIRGQVPYIQQQVHIIQVMLAACQRDPDPTSKHNLYDMYLLLCIQYQTPDDGQKTCLKHVEFYSKNKFQKLAHLVGFIIRIYHDTRSSEGQICLYVNIPIQLHNVSKKLFFCQRLGVLL